MKKLFFSCIVALSALSAPLTVSAGPSILDIKHSITDDNIVPPESFETKTRELEENFYLRNFAADASSQPGNVTLASPEVYEQRLSQLPTIIEMPYNDVVGKFIEMYLGKRSKLVSDMLALHNYYGPIFIEELEKEDLPLELQYLPVIESAINPNAVSRAGATGLWQFMPGTAKGLGMEVNSLVDQRRDPRASSKYAAKYLKQLYEIYGDWSLAISAYNCGPGNVNKAIKRAGGGPGEKKDFWEIYFYLPTETRGYLPAFIAANYVMNYYDKHGIKPRVVKQPLVTDTVEVSNRVHFDQISGVLNIPVEEIRMLNPQFRKDIIPGNNHPYALTLPSSQILSYVMSEQDILDFEKELHAQRTYVEPGKNSTDTPAESGDPAQPAARDQSDNADGNLTLAQASMDTPTRITHTVTHGENLRGIAKKYNVSITDLKRWNNLRRAKVQEGDELVIEVYDRPATPGEGYTSVSDVPQPPKKKEPARGDDVPEPRKEVKDATAEVPQPPTRDKDMVKDSKSTDEIASSTKSKSPAAAETKSQKSLRKDKDKDSGKGKGKGKGDSKSKKSSTKTVEVKGGDSLEKLAKQHNTTVKAIKEENGLKGDMIREGQKLKITPGKGAASSSKKGPSSKSTKKSSKKRK